MSTKNGPMLGFAEQAIAGADDILARVADGHGDLRGIIACTLMHRDEARQMLARMKAWMEANGHRPTRADYDEHDAAADAIARRLWGTDDADRLGLGGECP